MENKIADKKCLFFIKLKLYFAQLLKLSVIKHCVDFIQLQN